MKQFIFFAASTGTLIPYLQKNKNLKDLNVVPVIIYGNAGINITCHFY